MRSGPRNRRIVIERGTVTTDDYGGEALTWGTYAEMFAEFKAGTGQERREAAQEGATAPGTFRVLHNALTAAVTVKDRINFDGSYWDIVSNVPVGLNEGREITAVRSV